MSKVQKISIALTLEMNAMVQAAVESGQYASASEVVRDALRYWQGRERAKAEALEYTRALIQEGLDSGPGEDWDVEKMKQDFHASFATKAKLRKSA
jgi:antitoxin ParD1/3/4